MRRLVVCLIAAAALSLPARPSELDDILARAADYCEKLKRAAFRFICQEEVNEDVLNRAHKFRRTTWVYDYQIVGGKEKISEKRTLLSISRGKPPKDPEALQTRFRSHYSFYLPITMIGRERQALNTYVIAKKESVKKRPVAVLGVSARNPLGDYANGEVWVDIADGSVIRILLDQRAIRGVENLEKTAAAQGMRLQINDYHSYEVEREGIRFPSQTVISERYIVTRRMTADPSRYNDVWEDVRVPNVFPAYTPVYMSTRDLIQTERSRTYYTYKDYRFFVVQVGVKEEIK